MSAAATHASLPSEHKKHKVGGLGLHFPTRSAIILHTFITILSEKGDSPLGHIVKHLNINAVWCSWVMGQKVIIWNVDKENQKDTNKAFTGHSQPVQDVKFIRNSPALLSEDHPVGNVPIQPNNKLSETLSGGSFGVFMRGTNTFQKVRFEMEHS